MKTEKLKVVCRKNLEQYPYSSTIKDFQKFKVERGLKDHEDALIELLSRSEKLDDLEAKVDATRRGIHTL